MYYTMAWWEKKKTALAKMYDFDLEKWFVEKEQIKQLRQNPTAIIYVRVSDRQQVNEGNWLESQEKTCRDRAARNGVKVLELFDDKWISWAKLDREWLEKAIAYLKEKNKNYPQVTYFLCSEISRISRSEDINRSWEMKQKIESTNTQIILASSGTNISDQSTFTQVNADFQFVMAKSERLQIRDRSVAGTKAKLYGWDRCLAVPVWYERIHTKVNWKKEDIIRQLEPQASIIKEWLELFANWVLENQARVLEYFNNKKLVTNHRSPKPWDIKPSFVQRLFEPQKLYFYAWYIICPSYGILEPIVANHEPIITRSTMGKILDRLNTKWTKKVWVRKDNSETFPLRWVLYCPNCWQPMTGATSTGRLGWKYDYYFCKNCKPRENIRANELHEEYKKLLGTFTVKSSMVNLIDDILSNAVKEKNKILVELEKRDKKEIAVLNEKIRLASDKFGKASDEMILSKIQEEWRGLEEEKKALEDKLKDYTIQQKDFDIIYDRVKMMLVNPVDIWENFPVSVKVLQAWVRFGGKIYYKKNEGLRTPQISGLNALICSINSDTLTYGAGYGIRTHDPLDHNQML